MAPETRMAAIALAFAFGIIARAHLPTAIICAAMAPIVAAAIVFTRSRTRETVLILAAIFVLGVLRFAVDIRKADNDISRVDGRVSAIDGVICSDLDAAQDPLRFVLRVEQACSNNQWFPAGGLVQTSAYCAQEPAFPKVQYGDRVRLHVSPYPPPRSTNPGRFSYRDYLSRQGIHSCASIKTPGQISPLPGNRGNLLVRPALAGKHFVERSVYRVHPDHEASLVTGIVLGSYAYLSPQTFRDFSRTSTLHILAASGYNCFILLVGATWLLRRLRVSRGQNAVVIVLIGCYLLMVGPKPSLVRASVMAVLALLAMPLSRVPNVRNIFFAAGFIVLMAKPSDLFDVGFQLSFLSVWALICTGPMMTFVLSKFRMLSRSSTQPGGVLRSWVTRTGGIAASAALGTTAITLFTAPAAAYYFNYVSLVSVPANVCVAFGVPLLFGVGFASAALAFVPVAGHLIGVVGTVATRWMFGAVSYLGAMKYAAISVPSPGIFALIGYYMMLYAVLAYVRPSFETE